MGSSEAAVAGRGLCFAYERRAVLHEVDVEADRGAVTVIAGPNGSGKSTLLELLAGVRQPLRGEVSRRGRVALMVQRPAAPDSLPLTVQTTVAMGTWGRRMTRRRARDRVREMIDIVGLTGLESRTLASLSGGQRQRTLLAQALVRDADIILMDEPDVGLDAWSRRNVWRLLVDEARVKGVAVVCVSHDDLLIGGADAVIRLEEGRVAAA